MPQQQAEPGAGKPHDQSRRHLPAKFDQRLHAANIINHTHHQQYQRSQRKFLPPTKIKTSRHFGPRKQHRHQTRDLNPQHHRHAAVRPPFIGQIHHPKTDRRTTHHRREQVSHHETGQKNEQIFVQITKHIEVMNAD